MTASITNSQSETAGKVLLVMLICIELNATIFVLTFLLPVKNRALND